MHWPTKSFVWFEFLWYSLDCGCLELYPWYLWGMPVLIRAKTYLALTINSSNTQNNHMICILSSLHRWGMWKEKPEGACPSSDNQSGLELELESNRQAPEPCLCTEWLCDWAEWKEQSHGSDAQESQEASPPGVAGVSRYLCSWPMCVQMQRLFN